jgi:hypothetical protein
MPASEYLSVQTSQDNMKYEDNEITPAFSPLVALEPDGDAAITLHAPPRRGAKVSVVHM